MPHQVCDGKPSEDEVRSFGVHLVCLCKHHRITVARSCVRRFISFHTLVEKHPRKPLNTSKVIAALTAAAKKRQKANEQLESGLKAMSLYPMIFLR